MNSLFSRLAVPLENSTGSIEDLQKIGAVNLFVERAQSARPDLR